MSLATTKRIKLRGAVAQLFVRRDSRVMIDGPAGTGKTFGILRYCDWIARKYPGVRILWARETLRSLRQSAMQIYEDWVLGPDDPILGAGSRNNRTGYDYPIDPETGRFSHIECVGLDNTHRLRSSEWDIIVLFEATDQRVKESDWNYLTTRCRGTGIPHPDCAYPDGVFTDGRLVRDMMALGDFEGGVDENGHPLFLQRVLCDCNPSDEMHWLWRKFEMGEIVRYRSVHSDNPLVQNSYLEELAELKGVWRERYYLGHWVAAEGLIWETYNPHQHNVAVEWEMEPLTGRRFVRVPDWTDDNGTALRMPVSAVVAGMDWGYNDCGVLLVAAVTPERRAFVVREVYRQGCGLDWWAQQIEDAWNVFKVEAVNYATERPEHIALFNSLLGDKHGREAGGLVRAANNRRVSSKDGDMGGLDVVREVFRQNRLFFSRDMNQEPDQKRLGQRLPTSVIEEIRGYVFERDEHTNRLLEVPSDDCYNDGCDALRYLEMDIFGRDLMHPKKLVFPDAEGTAGYRVGTPQERARMKQLTIKREAKRKLTWE